MLEIKRFVFGPFETNCYVITNNQSPMTNDQSPMVLLIDPACSNESERGQLEQYIENQKSKIKNLQLSIVATHGHLDHLWGAAWACAKWNTPVLMHEADIPMAKAMQQQYDLFGIRAKAQPFPIEPISNHQSPITNYQSPIPPFRGEQGGRILHTPGHTPGSICLYFPKSKIENQKSPILLSGDTLFKMGYGRTDLPGGNYGQLLDSLDRLFALPPETVVYPGHGEPTTIAAERR